MAFDLQPVLEGELLTLRPLRADDFDALFAAASDPLIWEQHPASDRYTPQVFRAFFDESLASGGALGRTRHWLVSLLWIRRGAERDRDWLVVSRALALGRPIQW